MYTTYYIYSLIFVFLLVITRIWFITFFKESSKSRNQDRTRSVKTMIILGSGGHTAEMLRILNCLNFKNYSPRIYICAHTDTISAEKAQILEGKNIDYKIVKIYRSREVQQSYLSSIFTTLRAILNSIPLLWLERPELILCNGPGTCVPLCIKMCKDTSITRLIPWDTLSEELEKYMPVEIKRHLTRTAITLNASHKNEVSLSTKWIDNSLILVEACLDKTWEMLNSGYWKDVPIEHRYCYTLCTILKVVLLQLQYERSIKEPKERVSVLKNIIEQIDKGLLLGAPLSTMPDLLTRIASKLNEYYTKQVELSKTLTSAELIINSECICETILPGFSQVAEYQEPSMEKFYREIFMLKTPAVLKGCMKHWKALQRWKDLNYLTKVAGSRTVPIEIGSRYTEDDWTQHLINFSEFLQKHISTKSDKIGYLAQHQLFDQIPELKNDFAIPEYCNFTDNEEVEQPDINAWFGPGGTVSPLHFDPKNNFLSQVFGCKKVILYHPQDTSNLYPYDARLLNNTAQVDPVNPDYNKWPNFVKANGLMCYLKPGEMLYIPPKWWHHVTALTPSFSVSFWWN